MILRWIAADFKISENSYKIQKNLPQLMQNSWKIQQNLHTNMKIPKKFTRKFMILRYVAADFKISEN
jgi:hypothetical protein